MTPSNLPAGLLGAAGLLPVLSVFALILLARWDGVRAGVAGWVVALLVAVGVYGAGPRLLAYSQVRALFLAVDVLLIIAGALLLHAVLEQAGAYESLGRAAGALAGRPVLAAAAVGWALATVLQGVAGFGVPVAVVAPLLVGLGFAPELAVLVPSLGHAGAVTFGSIGNAMQAMLSATGQDIAHLGSRSAQFMALAGAGAGMAAVGLACGWRIGWRAWAGLAAMGLAMGLAEVALAATAYWPLASLGAGLTGLAAAGLALRWTAGPARPAAQPEDHALSMRDAAAPYGLLWLVVILARVPAIDALLDGAAVSVAVPETRTALGWVNPAGPTVAAHPLTGTGMLVALVALAGWAWLRRRGGPPVAFLPAVATLRARALRPCLAILVLVGMGEILQASGMNRALATLAATTFGGAFVWVTPWIGALGALITGTNTNSNLLFARLEMEAAAGLGLDLPTVMALQNVGAAIASVLSPAKIMVGLSTVGMVGAESRVMRRLAGPAFLVILAVTVYGVATMPGP